jgi:hypothetical protein
MDSKGIRKKWAEFMCLLAGCSEHGKEPSGSIKIGQFLD